MKLAIYGCWRGHSSKREFPDRESVLPKIACNCGEDATLYDVITEKPKFKVIDGGKP